MSIPSFKMTPSRIEKLSNYLQCKHIDNGTSSKKARKLAASAIRDAKVKGVINSMYYALVKFERICDSEIINVNDQVRKTVTRPGEKFKYSAPGQTDKLFQAPVIDSKPFQKKVPRLISFDPAMLEALSAKSKAMDCSMAHIVRTAVANYLG